MRIVVGVDLAQRYEPALALLHALKFPRAEVRLVHSVEPLLPDSSFPEPSSTGPIAEILAELEAAGQKELDRVAESVQPWSPGVQINLAFGRALGSLLSECEKSGADIVAVGSEGKGKWASYFLGSISKGLTIESPYSVLVGKQPITAGAPLRAVYATDLSPAATAAHATLAGFAPAGLGHVTVVHALEGASEASAAPAVEALCAETRSYCPSVSSVISAQKPLEAVHDAMKDADLLVIGARGHGWAERLILGSFAMVVVAREPWNVLVLRP